MKFGLKDEQLCQIQELLAKYPDITEAVVFGSLVNTACDYGALAAGISVTSPHTIHPDLDAGFVKAYAAAHGLRLAAAVNEPDKH